MDERPGGRGHDGRVHNDRGMLRVAAVQSAPVFLDRDASIDRVVGHVRANGEADLVVFPESAVPGYPDFVWRHKPWAEDDWYQRFHDNAVNVGTDLDAVRSAAAEASTWVALGITERSDTGTLFNSVVHVDQHGAIAGVHRKLIPTGPERMVWGNGQESVLSVVEVAGARVGTLICWENYMPLARAALYAEGIDVLLSPTFDNSDVWVPTLRHIAKEGRIFVVGVTPFLNGSHVPRDLPGADELYDGPEDWMSAGNTSVVAPGGEVLAGPVTGEEGTLVEDLDLNLVTRGRRQFDPAGHYSRPDVLGLTVTRPEPGGAPAPPTPGPVRSALAGQPDGNPPDAYAGSDD